MVSHKHYDPSKTTTYMADKTTVRALFAIAETYRMHIEHNEIKSTYVHDPVYAQLFSQISSHVHAECRE